VFSNAGHILQAALSGAGLGFLPEELVGEHVRAGRLLSVMEDWCPNYPGYHLYYPIRRQASPAFALVVEAVRWRADS
jgi:DNA-binding transcriptional LysR family regulator